MTRLNVLAEGYTERDFAEKLLAPYALNAKTPLKTLRR